MKLVSTSRDMATVNNLLASTRRGVECPDGPQENHFVRIVHQLLDCCGNARVRLLTGLTDKERMRLNRSGIFTVKRLSHTFRPRRRPKRLAAQSERYHHSLRALAIREQKIHIVGKLRLPIQGTPIFLDVESLPDSDFYYLVGIRIEVDGRPTLYSFWADTPSDEQNIWTDFLAVLSAIEKPMLIHYGSSKRNL